MACKTLYNLALVPDIFYHIPTHLILTPSLFFKCIGILPPQGLCTDCFFFLECSTPYPQVWLLHLLQIPARCQLLWDIISHHPIPFTLFYFLHNTYCHLTFIYLYFIVCLPSPGHGLFLFVCWYTYPQQPEKCPEHSRCSINTWWMNEWIELHLQMVKVRLTEEAWPVGGLRW